MNYYKHFKPGQAFARVDMSRGHQIPQLGPSSQAGHRVQKSVQVTDYNVQYYSIGYNPTVFVWYLKLGYILITFRQLSPFNDLSYRSVMAETCSELLYLSVLSVDFRCLGKYRSRTLRG